MVDQIHVHYYPNNPNKVIEGGHCRGGDEEGTAKK